MRYKSRQPRSERRLSCEKLEARRCLSAVTFSERQIISDEIDGPKSVYAADLDGDGDADVLSTSHRDRKIAWYENTDGKGSFGQQNVITRRAGWAVTVLAADVDGDSDFDVLIATFDSRIAWFENTDGMGAFGDLNLITRAADGPESVTAVDVDGDHDVDILSASQRDNKIAWYENTDGKGTFGPQQVITTAAIFARSVDAADVDGDGDMDVLSAALGDSLSGVKDDKIAWYENTDGMGAFGPENVITTEINGPASVQAADVDGDGDMDILSSSAFDSKYAWHENTDGNGAFGPPKIISTVPGHHRGGAFHAADFDGDADVDVLTAFGGAIGWHENTDGMGDFGPQIVIGKDNSGSYAADVDGDGDVDVLSGSYEGDNIGWYENLSPQIAAGDANRDCQFDQLDIVQVLQAAKYLAEEPATFQEGDWNGDGVFDQLDIVAALQTGNYLQGPYAALRDN